MPPLQSVHTLNFLAGLAVVSVSILVCWDIIRSSMRGTNLRPLLFGAGVLVTTVSFLITDITRVFSYPPWLYYVVGFGYALMALALVVNKRDYLIFLALPLAVLPPKGTLTYLIVTLPILWIAHLAYRQYCLVNCTSLHTLSVKQDRLLSDIWSAIITLFALISATYLLVALSYPPVITELILVSAIFLKLTTFGLLTYVAFRFVKLTRRESYVFPIILAFVIVSAGAIFLTSTYITVFIQDEYKLDVTDDAQLFSYIANQNYPSGLLAKKIEARSSSLNDLADQVFLATGVRGVFFLGNVRVAAAPSVTNGSRNIGTKIDDQNVSSTVLGGGKDYTGFIQKNGQIIAASYIPVTDNGKVIGMVAIGKTLKDYDELKNRLIDTIIAGGIAIMAIIIGAVFFESRKNLKASKNH